MNETDAPSAYRRAALVGLGPAAAPVGFLIAIVAAAVWWHEIEHRWLRQAGTAVLVALGVGCAWYYLGSM